MRRPPVQAEQGDKGTAAFAVGVDMRRGHLTLTLQTGTIIHYRTRSPPDLASDSGIR
jgi:hypothetical protein